MTASDLLAALRDRWRLGLAIAAIMLVIIGFWISIQPRTYQASSSLLFDVSQPDPSLGDEERATQPGANLIGTQSDIIVSTFVARSVAEQLAREQGQKRSDAELDRQANGLIAQTVVQPGKASNVLEITVSDRDPARAAVVANLFASTFLSKQRDLREIAARGYARWLDERTRDVRARLVDAQGKLAEYQRAQGVIGANRMDLEAERLRSLNSALAASEGDSAQAGSRTGNAAVPEVEFSQLVQTLQTEVARRSARVAELSRTLGPNHPDMAAARADLAETQANLSRARASAATALSAGDRSAKRRESDLRQRLNAQQQRMIALSGSQESLAILQQDVDTARATYESVRKRYGDVALRSQITQTNATQLDRASVPAVPVRPNVMLLAVLGAIFSIGVGLSAVLGFELLNPRVRTGSGVAARVGRPVIADFSSSWSWRRRPPVGDDA